VVYCTMGTVGLLQLTRVLGLPLSVVLLCLGPSMAAGSFTFPVITDEATQVLRICTRLLFMYGRSMASFGVGWSPMMASARRVHGPHSID
jgi:hypothetical protein